MVDGEIIKGKRVRELIQTARDGKTLVNMQLARQSFERLTVFTDVAKVRRRWVVRVDMPNGFKQFISDLDAHSFTFSFQGSDAVEYSFAASGGVADGKKGLRFPLPETLVRLQRRSNFRMETPVGTTLQFTLGDQPGALDLINISIGGTLGILAKPRKIDPQDHPLKTNDVLTNLKIILPPDRDGETQQVSVQRAVVRRIEHDADRQIFRYAVEFQRMAPADERILVQFVFQLQRRFLRRNIDSA